MTRRLALSLTVPFVVVLAVVSGCTGEEPTVTADPPSPFADCTVLTSAPAATPTSAAAPAPAPALATPAPALATPAPALATPAPALATPAPALATPAPALATPAPAGATLTGLTLPCFTGGEPVALDALPGPLVINLWASWCKPCRKELPAFQRLADRSGGQVRVLGVNTRDGRSQATSIGTDFNLTFPNLVDREEELLNRITRPLLPTTLFVDRQGRLRHVDQSGALDDTTLTALVRRHLDVVVPE